MDDHQSFRDQLAQLLREELGMAVCGETDNIRDALSLIEKARPELALVDITLRGASGLELIKDCKARGIELKVLVISMLDEDLYAERVLRAGARGYLTKSATSDEVVKAIRCVLDGGVYVSGRVISTLLDRVMGKSRKAVGIDTLTDRELEVFSMLGRGKKAPEIAETLHLGESTVDTYRWRIREKLGLSSAAELYERACEWLRERSSGEPSRTD